MMENGIYKMSMAEYRSAPGVSKSDLDILHRCPAAYRDKREGKLPDVTTDAMEFGTLLHSLVLDGEEPYYVRPERYGPEGKPWHNSAKDCKDWNQAHSDKPILSPFDADKLKRVATAILSDPLASSLLMQATHREASMFAGDDDSGLLLKGRADIIGPDFIADIKSTRDASTSALSRTIVNYRYHVQAAMYRRIMHALGQPKARWYFIAVESDPIPRVNVRELHPLAIVQGEAELERDLEMLQQCRNEGFWPGLSGDGTKIDKVDIPAWAYTDSVEVQLTSDKVKEIPAMSAEEIL